GPVDAAALDLWLQHRLQVPGDRLRRGAVRHHGRPRSGAGARRRAPLAPGGGDMIARIARAVVTVVILVIVMLPIYWMVSSSLKPNREITQDGTLYPHAPSFDNYTHLFSEKQFGHFFLNSVGVTAISVALALAAGSLGAYAIARFRLRFGLERWIGLALLTLRIVPPVVILIPIYLLMLRLSLLDTWLGLIITYTAINITFCVWMMESFFREIPLDLEEAAMVDGDSRFTAFRRIVLVLTATPRAMTMPRGTATLIGRIDTDWASMSAAGVVGALPIVIFALLVQRHLVRGLTMGAVK